MAKKIVGKIKLLVPGGAATPAPPLGPALGQKGVDIKKFCDAFNARTRDKKGISLPVLVTIYVDKSFDFLIKSPPVSQLIKKILKIEKGSAIPNKQKIGNINVEQLKEIAEVKMVDLNCSSMESAMKMVAGTAKSMGITPPQGY